MNRCWSILCCALLVMPLACAPAAKAPDTTTTLASQDTLTSTKHDNPTAGPANTPILALSDTIATVHGKPITVEQILRPMTEAYGLNFLLHLAQLELCKQKAAAANVAITPDDIAAERQRTLDQMFKDAIPTDSKLSPEEQEKVRQKEFERLLSQFLTSQRISEPEFDLAMQTGAYLRKLAEPGLMDKITEQHIKDGFGILFGEKVRVRHIQLANMREVAEAQRRLREGQAFEKVAKDLSTDGRSRNAGGELRAFSRAEPSWPQAFKDAAFALKDPGEVAEPVQAGNAYHIIKLVARIPPNSAVKLETHKDYVRDQLFQGLLIVRTRELRENLAIEARSALKINDPGLRKQYVQRLERAAGESARDPNLIRKDIELDNRKPATRPTTQPEESRPPATMPGQ